MPQLDIGIFFIEFFLNFFCFWLIYLLKAKNIFPSLNKSIKLRKYKIKKINNFLNLYVNNFSFLNNFFQNNKNNLDSLVFNNFNSYFLKINFIYFLILKNYYNFFLLKNNENINKKLNKQIYINKI